MPDGPVLLVIDDEIQIRRFLRASLTPHGYHVHEAASGHEGLTLAATLRPDLIILDLGLPDMDGGQVLARLREWSHVPVIVLSARTSEEDKIALLDAGADDYLTKPFGPGELMARVRAAQRHAQPAPDNAVFQAGALRVDLLRRIVKVNDDLVQLTATEYALLRLFIRHAGNVLTHTQILREVWGPDYVDEVHYLRVYLANLRKKLEADPANPTLFVTEPGVGYRLVVD